MSNTTLLEISTMADEAWINNDVHCIVDVQQPRMSKGGKPFYPIKLTDPDDASAPVISTTVFQDPSKFHGKVCVLSGKGNKKTSYNNNAQIAVGKNGFFKIVGDAAPSAPAPLPRQPQGVAASQQAPRPAAPAPLPPNRPVSTVNGQSVGMAINNANLHLMHYNIALNDDTLWDAAKIFLRVSGRFERGEHMQQSEQPVKRPVPGPNGQVAESDFDEQVPF